MQKESGYKGYRLQRVDTVLHKDFLMHLFSCRDSWDIILLDRQSYLIIIFVNDTQDPNRALSTLVRLYQGSFYAICRC